MYLIFSVVRPGPMGLNTPGVLAARLLFIYFFALPTASTCPQEPLCPFPADGGDPLLSSFLAQPLFRLVQVRIDKTVSLQPTL